MSGPDSEKTSNGAEPIAIIGIGCAFPGAPGTEAFWSNIKSGRDTITEIPNTYWRTEDYFDADPSAPDMTYARRGGFLDPVEFPPLDFGISPNNIEATDTTQLLGMMVAREALRDAGYAAIEGRDAGRDFDRQRTSVILGVTGALELVIPLGARLGHPIWRKALKQSGVDDQTAEQVVKRIGDAYVPWQENSFPGLLGNVAAGRIANRFDLGGTNCVVDAACASSLSAIHMAAMELHAGDADMVISGGMDTFNDIFMYMCFSKTPALSPTGSSRPFSGDGDGTILGEGLGIVVLKRLADAKRDGDRIYAVIRGVGSASDGQGSAIYEPQSRGQAKAMRAAYQRSEVSPDTVELLEAHGTGTRVGDAVELESASSVYRQHSRDEIPWCALGSVKSMIGHTKAAAGAAGLIKIALALKHKVLPPTINVTRPLPGPGEPGSPLYVNTEARPWIPRGAHPRRAAVSAFGFGGSNFHCVLEEYGGEKLSPEWSGEVLLFPLSAQSRDHLRQRLSELSKDGDRFGLRALSARLRTRYHGEDTARLVFLHDGNAASFRARCTKLLRLLDASENKTFFQTPDGATFAEGAPPGQLCALFPGQGSQYVGMLREWACQFPELLETLEAANQVHGIDKRGHRLSDRIFPIPVFDDPARNANEGALRDTRTAQPAIGALSLGALNVLKRFGVDFHAAAGHSFGELTALCAAGRISESDFHRLATTRGAIMAALDGDRGAMVAVAATVEAARSLIDGEQLDLVIANRNAPEQIVLSGDEAAVDTALKICEQRGLSARRLPVSAAFHSALVADAKRPFHDALKRVEFHSGNFPAYSNTSAEPYPDDVNEAKALLSGQLANPVDFVEEIENLYAAGVRTFVEVGPSNKLTGLVSAILGEREHHAIAMDASRGARSAEYDLGCLLARLAALGYAVDLEHFDESANSLAHQEPAAKDKLTITLTGANYMKPTSLNENDPPQVPTPSRPTAAKAPPSPAPVRSETSPLKPAKAPVEPTISTTAPSAHAADALRLTQENILALQQLQQQTAELHSQYLNSQETSQRTIERLMEQQARLLGLPEPTAVPAVKANAPTPVAVEAPARAAPAQLAPTAAVVAHLSQRDDTSLARNALIAVVVEKTGYPADMLSLDMSLDADLGIDSIKRVEIFSALNDALPDVAEISPDEIGRFRTLKDVADYCDQNSTTSEAPVAEPASHPQTQSVAAPAADPPTSGVILDVVAEKTGYPKDMLSIDMDLDADLGIDSIKRVEILSALQERIPSAPDVPPDAMGRFRTLADVAQFIGAGKTAAARDPAALGKDSARAPAGEKLLLSIVAEKTGYPEDMLSLDMSLDADLGIDSIKRVEILSALQERLEGAGEIDASEMGALRTLADVYAQLMPSTKGQADTGTSALHYSDVGVPASAEVRLEKKILVASAHDENAPGEPIAFGDHSEIWVTDDGAGLAASICDALNKAGGPAAKLVSLQLTKIPKQLAGLVLVSPPDADHQFVLDAFRLIRAAGDVLQTHAQRGGALIAGITRINGAFGLNGGAIAQPLSAGLGGLIKSAHAEWLGIAAKVIDVDADAPALAQRIARTLSRQGPLEVGYTLTEAVVLKLHNAPDETHSFTPPFAPEDLVVVSGGARGVTAEVAVAIAQSCRSPLLLLGRSAISEQEPEWLQDVSDTAEIRSRLVQRNSRSGRTPADIETELNRILAQREIHRTLDRIRAAGSEVRYRSVDVRDYSQVATAINDARREFGPVRGVVHGAGVIADRLIVDKTDEQFETVFATKVRGLENLMRATADDSLKVLSLFSSSTARFGRKGQVDYAAANEVLNKCAQREAKARPDCRVVSINWGPWDGGMVSADLKRVFAAEGVGTVPLEAGAALHLREIASASQNTVEIVVIARFGLAVSSGVATPTNAGDN